MSARVRTSYHLGISDPVPVNEEVYIRTTSSRNPVSLDVRVLVGKTDAVANSKRTIGCPVLSFENTVYPM